MLGRPFEVAGGSRIRIIPCLPCFSERGVAVVACIVREKLALCLAVSSCCCRFRHKLSRRTIRARRVSFQVRPTLYPHVRASSTPVISTSTSTTSNPCKPGITQTSSRVSPAPFSKRALPDLTSRAIQLTSIHLQPPLLFLSPNHPSTTQHHGLLANSFPIRDGRLARTARLAGPVFRVRPSKHLCFRSPLLIASLLFLPLHAMRWMR